MSTISENSDFENPTLISVNSVLDQIYNVGQVHTNLLAQEDANKKLTKQRDYFRSKLIHANKKRRSQVNVIPLSQLTELQKKHKETEDELHTCVNRYLIEKQELYTKLKNTNENYATLKTELEVLKKQKNSFVKPNKCKGHVDKIVQLELEKTELQENCNLLNDKFQTLQLTYNEANKEFKELEKKYDKFNLDNIALNSSANQLGSDIQCLRIELENCKIQNNELKILSKNQCEVIRKLEEENKQLKCEIEELKTPFEVVRKLKEENKQLKCEIEELKTPFEVVRKLKEENEQLKCEIEELKTSFGGGNQCEELRKLEEENEQLKCEIEGLKTPFEGGNQCEVIRKLKEENEQLKCVIEELKTPFEGGDAFLNQVNISLENDVLIGNLDIDQNQPKEDFSITLYKVESSPGDSNNESVYSSKVVKETIGLVDQPIQEELHHSIPQIIIMESKDPLEENLIDDDETSSLAVEALGYIKGISRNLISPLSFSSSEHDEPIEPKAVEQKPTEIMQVEPEQKYYPEVHYFNQSNKELNVIKDGIDSLNIEFKIFKEVMDVQYKKGELNSIKEMIKAHKLKLNFLKESGDRIQARNLADSMKSVQIHQELETAMNKLNKTKEDIWLHKQKVWIHKQKLQRIKEKKIMKQRWQATRRNSLMFRMLGKFLQEVQIGKKKRTMQIKARNNRIRNSSTKKQEIHLSTCRQNPLLPRVPQSNTSTRQSSKALDEAKLEHNCIVEKSTQPQSSESSSVLIDDGFEGFSDTKSCDICNTFHSYVNSRNIIRNTIAPALGEGNVKINREKLEAETILGDALNEINIRGKQQQDDIIYEEPQQIAVCNNSDVVPLTSIEKDESSNNVDMPLASSSITNDVSCNNIEIQLRSIEIDDPSNNVEMPLASSSIANDKSCNIKIQLPNIENDKPHNNVKIVLHSSENDKAKSVTESKKITKKRKINDLFDCEAFELQPSKPTNKPKKSKTLHDSNKRSQSNKNKDKQEKLESVNASVLVQNSCTNEGLKETHSNSLYNRNVNFKVVANMREGLGDLPYSNKDLINDIEVIGQIKDLSPHVNSSFTTQRKKRIAHDRKDTSVVEDKSVLLSPRRSLRIKNNNIDWDESPASPEMSPHIPSQANNLIKPKIIPLEAYQNDTITRYKAPIAIPIVPIAPLVTTSNKATLSKKDFKKMEKDCTEVILQLFGNSCKGMVTRVANILQQYNCPKVIARLIVETSTRDVVCRTMKFNNPRAPQLSKIQFELVHLLLELKRKQCDDIISHFLDYAERTIQSAQSISVLSPIARLHLAFLKSSYNFNRMKPMIYVALAKMNNLAVPYIYIMFTCWPDLFTNFENLNEYRKLIARALIAIINLFKSNYSLPLRGALHHQYGYPINTEPLNVLLKELLERYIETKQEELKAIILISGKNLTSKLFFQQVEATLKPIILNSTNESNSCLAVNLLKFLIYELRCNPDMTNIIMENRNWLIIFSKGVLPLAIKTECTVAIETISKL